MVCYNYKNSLTKANYILFYRNNVISVEMFKNLK